jgi:hypothetical protein
MHQFSVDLNLFTEKVINIVLTLNIRTLNILGFGHNFVLHSIL